METNTQKQKGHDAATMEIVVAHPTWTLAQVRQELALKGFKAVRKTYNTTKERLTTNFKPILRLKGGVQCIDPYMAKHPFASIEDVAKHMEERRFDMNALTVQRTLHRRYNFNTQINKVILESKKYTPK
jgi:hypothetical protein